MLKPLLKLKCVLPVRLASAKSKASQLKVKFNSTPLSKSTQTSPSVTCLPLKSNVSTLKWTTQPSTALLKSCASNVVHSLNVQPPKALLTAARVLQGAGAAAGMVIGRALVQDLFSGPERTRVMAWIGMAMGLCPPAATIIGGQLHVRLGWQANFFVMAALAVLLFIAAWRGLPAHAPTTTHAQAHWLRAMLASYGQLARSRAFVLYATVVCMTTATFYTFLAGAPIVLGSYGVGPDRVGFYIMFVPLAYIVGNYTTSRLVQRQGDRRMLVAGHAFTVAGLALLVAGALMGLNTPLAFSLPLMLVGIGHGLLVPPALAGTVGLMPALAGSAAAVAGATQQLTGALGGYAVGLVPHHGAANLGWLMLAFTLGGVAALVWLLRTSLPR